MLCGYEQGEGVPDDDADDDGDGDSASDVSSNGWPTITHSATADAKPHT